MAVRRLQFTPTARPTSTRTPSKNSLDSVGLYLQQVIGTTSTSSNGFDYLESARSFAFLAGAGAVLASVDDDLRITQRFYRAKPSLNGGKPSTAFSEPQTLPGAPQSPRKGSVFIKRDGPSAFPSPGLEQLDSPNFRGVTSKERTKAASCVCLSPNGKLLALGEIGHKPKILIFSTAQGSSSATPLTILSEHTFGVQCLAFSSNSLWLASLGDINDGFLYVWAINYKTGGATLHASNKCTSSLRQIAWLGNSLITVGTRHVKIWRVENNNGDVSDESGLGSMYTPLQTLSGRNCLLGALLERTFTVVLAVRENKAIICSDQGDICLIDDSGAMPQFSKIAGVEFPVHSAVIHSDDYLLVGGKNGKLVEFRLDTLFDFEPVPGTSVESGTSDNLVALGAINSLLITLDSRRRFQLVNLLDLASETSKSLIKRLPAHGAAILGVQALSQSTTTFDAASLTWSAEGLVLLWDHEGNNVGRVEVLKDPDTDGEGSNELKTVRTVEKGGFLVSGDRHGWLRIQNIRSGKVLCETKAHLGEITDLAVVDMVEQVLIASAGRDRMVQVSRYKQDKLDLLQTLDEHVGVVIGLSFTKDGSKLISYSTDRTIVVRDDIPRGIKGVNEIAFLATRTITLKSSPISGTLDYLSEDVFLVSTTDRRVQGYNIHSGRLTMDFKTSDLEGGDSVILNSIQHLTLRGYPVIAGVSSSDKSIRLYDGTGRLLAREYGPTEGMTGIAVYLHESKPDGKGLITVAADGTIFSWNLSLKGLNASDEIAKTQNALVSKPPLRRILSATDVARLQALRDDAGDVGQIEPSKGRRMSPERRSPERQLSRLSLISTPRLESSPILKSPTREKSPSAETRSRRTAAAGRLAPVRQNSKSQIVVASPVAHPTQALQSVKVPSRRKTLGSSDAIHEAGSLESSTDEICQRLRLYRNKLAGDLERLSKEKVRETEEELQKTIRALTAFSQGTKGTGEG